MFRFFSTKAWREALFSKRNSRRLSARGALLSCTACVLEMLEPRYMMAADLDLQVLPGTSVPGAEVEITAIYSSDQAGGGQRGTGAFADYFGATNLAPTNTDVDVPIDGAWFGATFGVNGSEGNQAAYQAFDGNGAGQITLFDSLLSANGGNGSTAGIINAMRLTPNGVSYAGESAGGIDFAPTMWSQASDPSGGFGPNGQPDSGFLLDIDGNGIAVGTIGSAIYATHGNLPELFPGVAAGATDVSNNGSSVAGSLLWQKNEFGNFQVVNTSGFDFSVSGGTPTWVGTEVDAIGEVFYAGLFFDLNTFENSIGFWDSTGAYLGAAGTEFADFDVVNGDVVAAVNGGDDASLVRVRDMSTLSIESLIGSKALFPEKGLFAKDGALGLLLEDGDGAFVTVIQTANEGGGDPPIVVDLFFDCDGDGVIDGVVQDQNTGSVMHQFSAVGTYDVEVIAKDQNGNEMARETMEFVVEPFTVVQIDGEDVLMVGADQTRGSNINISKFGDDFSIRVDRERGTAQADRVEVYGSDRRDSVRLMGEFEAALSLGAGNDSLYSFGANVSAHLGDGNDRALSFSGAFVDLFGGAGNDRLYSFGHEQAFIDAGSGNDFMFTRGYSSFVVAGAGADRIYNFDERAVVISGLLDYSDAEVDAVFSELGSADPDYDFLEAILSPLEEDDGERDRGFLLNDSSLLLDGDKDRIWSF